MSQDIDLRFVRRSHAESVPGHENVSREVTIKVLQQRLKSGTYGSWGEWHDVPTVDASNNDEET